MKKRTCLALCLALLLLLAAGCGGGAASGNTAAPSSPAASAPTAESPDYGNAIWDGELTAPEEAWDMQGSAGGSMGSVIYQNPNAKLIRRAELSIQTEQFDQSVEALNRMVSECGGYFENASVYGGGRRDAYSSRQGDYIVRIPAEKYTQFFNSAGELGYVISSTESSEDVGEQYYDVEARLKTQRTKQERLLSLLEKAETMEDIISLENALSDVEYQIEQFSSELNRYDALIGFSTFQIYLSEVGQVTQEVGTTASLGDQLAAGVQASFRGLVRGGQDFLIWVSYHLFLCVILAAVVVAAVVVGRREWKKRPKDTDKKEG